MEQLSVRFVYCRIIVVLIALPICVTTASASDDETGGHVTDPSTVCPVRPSDGRGSCRCTSTAEIRCEGLLSVPVVDVEALQSSDDVTYRQLYLSGQQIRSVPAAAFASLRVRSIVLNFNLIEDRLDPNAFKGSVDVVQTYVRRLQRWGDTSSGLNTNNDTHRRGGTRSAAAATTSRLDHLRGRVDDVRSSSRHRHAGQRRGGEVFDVDTAAVLERRRRSGDIQWELFEGYDHRHQQEALVGSTRTGLKDTLLELSIGACRIRNLPNRLLHDIERLERLYLWGNHIEILPSGLFQHSARLLELSLWGNHIDELDADIFEGLRSLRHLDLDRNRLTSLPQAALSRLTSLRTLRLANNRIHALSSDVFAPFGGLRSLRLDGNGLSFVFANAFHGLSNLRSLSLDDNNVHILPDDVFSDLGRLVELGLRNNRVERVWWRTFYGLKSLVRLCLSSNRIAQLPDGSFHDSPRLRYVALHRNRLRTVRRCALPGGAGAVGGGVVAGALALTRLMLDANPLECDDCQMFWMRASSAGSVNRQQSQTSAGSSKLRVSGTCWSTKDRLLPTSLVVALEAAADRCNAGAGSSSAQNKDCCSGGRHKSASCQNTTTTSKWF